MRRFLLAWFALSVLIFVADPAWPQTFPQKPVALVIGISTYKSTLGYLPHAAPDSRAVAFALADAGFDVTQKEDLSKAELTKVLKDFAEDNYGAEVALVFFSGHGVQIEGRNFLLTSDTDYDSTQTLRNSSLPLDEVFRRAEQTASHRFILIDACRSVLELDSFHHRFVPGLERPGLDNISPTAPPEDAPAKGR